MLLHHKRFVANCPHCGQNAIQMIVFMLDQFSHIIIHAHRLFLPVLIMVTQDTMVTLMPESSNTASDRAPLSSISSMTKEGRSAAENFSTVLCPSSVMAAIFPARTVSFLPPVSQRTFPSEQADGEPLLVL